MSGFRPGSQTASVALLASAALAFGGCGERSFSADEFVQEANDNGATLELGKTLVTDDPSKEELYEITLEPLPGEEGAAEGEPATEEHAHGGGSLAVYDDGNDAEQGVIECEAAADLLCYRAGNVVIVLEGEAVTAEQVALAAALKEMAE